MVSVLGKGSYGEVRVENGMAVKKFRKLYDCVQEYGALRYLDDCSHVVKVKGVDFYNLEIYMELYDCSLRSWLKDNPSADLCSRLSILREILCGLVQIHDRGLAHGDLKPNNILVRNGEKMEVVLGDCGFVSVIKYAKVERTAPGYRDPVIGKDVSHDMFSLGVVMLELISRVKVGSKPTYRQLNETVRAKVEDPYYADILCSLFDEERKNRPSARKLLSLLFDVSLPPWKFQVDKMDFSSEEVRRLRTAVKKMGRERGVLRAKKGYGAVASYVSRKGLSSVRHEMHVTVTMMILSALFGSTSFKEKDCLEVLEGDEWRVVLGDLLSDRTYVTIILSP